MSDTREDFQNPLRALLILLQDLRIPHVLSGGLAVSQLSIPRLTRDRIERVVREFGEALTMPELLTDLRKTLDEP